MNDPDAYPELILDSAQERIRALARQQAREEARRATRAARRRSYGDRGTRWPWWPSRRAG